VLRNSCAGLPFGLDSVGLPAYLLSGSWCLERSLCVLVLFTVLAVCFHPLESSSSLKVADASSRMPLPLLTTSGSLWRVKWKPAVVGKLTVIRQTVILKANLTPSFVSPLLAGSPAAKRLAARLLPRFVRFFPKQARATGDVLVELSRLSLNPTSCGGTGTASDLAAVAAGTRSDALQGLSAVVAAAKLETDHQAVIKLVNYAFK